MLYSELVKGEDISRHFMTFSKQESMKLNKAVSTTQNMVEGLKLISHYRVNVLGNF